MNKIILQQLKQKFSTQYSDKLNFVLTTEVADIIFNIINESGIFSPKLKKSDIFLFVDTKHQTDKDKGQFFEYKNLHYKVAIRLIKNDFGDNFQKVVSVLCHEMIHAYDYFYGKLKLAYDGEFFTVNNIKHKQIVNNIYDAHGRFFQNYINKFKTYGIEVKISYNSKDTIFMKKIKESKKILFFGKLLKESTKDEDIKIKATLEKRASRVKDSELIFIDKNNWAIGID